MNFRKTLVSKLPVLAISLITALPAVSISAPSAYALSCMRPEITRSFDYWNKSDKTYVLVRGVLNPTRPLPKPPVPSGDINAPTPPQPHIYQFSGKIIGKHTDRKWQGPVTVTPTCVAAWCASHFKGSGEAIIALEVNGPNYALTYGLTYGPCGGSIFNQDLDKNEAALRACLKGNCPAAKENF